MYSMPVSDVFKKLKIIPSSILRNLIIFIENISLGSCCFYAACYSQAGLGV